MRWKSRAQRRKEWVAHNQQWQVFRPWFPREVKYSRDGTYPEGTVIWLEHCARRLRTDSVTNEWYYAPLQVILTDPHEEAERKKKAEYAEMLRRAAQAAPHPFQVGPAGIAGMTQQLGGVVYGQGFAMPAPQAQNLTVQGINQQMMQQNQLAQHGYLGAMQQAQQNTQK